MLCRQLHNFCHTLSRLATNNSCQKKAVKFTNKSYLMKAWSTMPDKSFSFDDYDIVGFDLDNTLVLYNLEEMIPLEYYNIANFLVERRGYPKEILRPIGNDVDFLQKGLILDTYKGNIIKICPKGRILKASHGTAFLSDDEIIREYGPDKRWDVATKFVTDPLSTWNGPLSEEMRTLLDYFDMPASLVFARSVDAIDLEKKCRAVRYNIYSDILAAMIQMFKRESFAEGTSEYFEAIKNNPKRYIMKTNRRVIEWLKELKKTKATFLLTGSNADFASLTASTSLGPHWQELFDVVVCFARKPGFFVDERPFYKVKDFKEIPKMLDKNLKLNNTYSQGNWTQLKQTLSTKFKVANPRLLYIGDNLIQDIHTPSKHASFDTICVSEEMLAEAEKKSNAFSKIIKSNFWGSYFFVGDKETYWNAIIKSHSKMCVPTLDSFCEATSK